MGFNKGGKQGYIDYFREFFSRLYNNFREICFNDYKSARGRLERAVSIKDLEILDRDKAIELITDKLEGSKIEYEREFKELAGRLDQKDKEIKVMRQDVENQRKEYEENTRGFRSEILRKDFEIRGLQQAFADQRTEFIDRINNYETSISNYETNIEEYLRRIKTLEECHEKEVRENASRINSLEGLVKWKEHSNRELRKEWFGYFRSLVGKVFSEEPYIFVDNNGKIVEVSSKAGVLFKYEGHIIGRRYFDFVSKETKLKGIKIGREFELGGRTDAYMEKILLRFPGKKKIKLNVSVFPCVGPRDRHGSKYIGYIFLFEKAPLKYFQKDRGLREYVRGIMERVNLHGEEKKVGLDRKRDIKLGDGA